MNGRTKIIAMVLVALVIGYGSITIINSSSRNKKIEIVVNELETAKTSDELIKAIANARALSPREKETILLQAVVKAEIRLEDEKEKEDWKKFIGEWQREPESSHKGY